MEEMTRKQIHIGDMSHETAIGILTLMLEAMATYDGISPTTERINAVKMAIESLAMPSVTPQLSSELEKNSKKLEKNFGELDCISREQALGEFCIYNSYDSIGVDKVRSYLKALPSVTPQEPKTGRWNDIPKYKDIAWQCSECERFTTMKHNYCPNCGAKMVEPQESEG